MFLLTPCRLQRELTVRAEKVKVYVRYYGITRISAKLKKTKKGRKKKETLGVTELFNTHVESVFWVGELV